MEKKVAESPLPTTALQDVSELESSCGEDLKLHIEENSSVFTFFRPPAAASKPEDCIPPSHSQQHSKCSKVFMNDDGVGQVNNKCKDTEILIGCLDSDLENVIASSTGINKSKSKKSIQQPKKNKMQHQSKIAFMDKSECSTKPYSYKSSEICEKNSTAFHPAISSTGNMPLMSSKCLSSCLKNQDQDKITYCDDDSPGDGKEIGEHNVPSSDSGLDIVDVLLMEDSSFQVKQPATVHHKSTPHKNKRASAHGRHFVKEQIYPSIVDEDWEANSFISQSRYDLYARNQAVKKNYANLLRNGNTSFIPSSKISKQTSSQPVSPLLLPPTEMHLDPNLIASGSKPFKNAHEELCKRRNRKAGIREIKSKITFKNEPSNFLLTNLSSPSLHQRRVLSKSCGTAKPVHTVVCPELNATLNKAVKTNQNPAEKSGLVINEQDSPLMHPSSHKSQKNGSTAVKIDSNIALEDSNANLPKCAISMKERSAFGRKRCSAMKRSILDVNCSNPSGFCGQNSTSQEKNRIDASKSQSNIPKTTNMLNYSCEINPSIESNSPKEKKYKILLPSGNNSYRWVYFSLPTDCSQSSVTNPKNCSGMSTLSPTEERDMKNTLKLNQLVQSTELGDSCTIPRGYSSKIRFTTRVSSQKSKSEIHSQNLPLSLSSKAFQNESNFNSKTTSKTNINPTRACMAKSFKNEQHSSCLQHSSEKNESLKVTSVYKNKTHKKSHKRSGGRFCSESISDYASIKKSNCIENLNLETKIEIYTKNCLAKVTPKIPESSQNDMIDLHGISEKLSSNKASLHEKMNQPCEKEESCVSRTIMMEDQSLINGDEKTSNDSAGIFPKVCVSKHYCISPTSTNSDKNSRFGSSIISLKTHHTSKIQPLVLNTRGLVVARKLNSNTVSVNEANSKKSEQEKNSSNSKYSPVKDANMISLTVEEIENLCESSILCDDQQNENRKEIHPVPITYQKASLFPQECSDGDCGSNMEFAVKLPGNDAIMPSAEAEQISAQFFPNTVRSFANDGTSNDNDFVILSSSDQLTKQATNNQKQSTTTDSVTIQSLSDKFVTNVNLLDQPQSAIMASSPATSSMKMHAFQIPSGSSFPSKRTVHKTQCVTKSYDSDLLVIKRKLMANMPNQDGNPVSNHTQTPVTCKKKTEQSCGEDFLQIPKITLNQDSDGSEDEIVDVNSYCEEDRCKIQVELLKSHPGNLKEKKIKSPPARICNTLTNKRLRLGHVSAEFDSVVANLNYEISQAKRRISSSSTKSYKDKSKGSTAPQKSDHSVVNHIGETKFDEIKGVQERLLEEIFYYAPHPPSQLISSLVKLLHQSYRKVNNWFTATRTQYERAALPIRRHSLKRCNHCALDLPRSKGTLHHILRPLHLRRALQSHYMTYLREMKSQGKRRSALTGKMSLQPSKKLSNLKIGGKQKTIFSTLNEAMGKNGNEESSPGNETDEQRDICVFVEENCDPHFDQEKKCEYMDGDENIDVVSWEEDPLLGDEKIPQVVSRTLEPVDTDVVQQEGNEVVGGKYEPMSEASGFSQPGSLPHVAVRTNVEIGDRDYSDSKDSVPKDKSYACSRRNFPLAERTVSFQEENSVRNNGHFMSTETDPTKTENFMDGEGTVINREANTENDADIREKFSVKEKDTNAEEQPLNTKGEPLNDEEMLASTEEAPANTEEAPANTEGAPANTEGAPANTEEAPANTEGAPANTEGAPANTEGAPANTEGAPANTEGAPANTEGTPANTEGDFSDGERKPSNAVGKPYNLEKPSFREGKLINDEERPSRAEEIFSNSEMKPSKEEKKLLTAEEGPSTAAEGPSTAAEGPSTAAEGPSTAAEGPSDGEGKTANHRCFHLRKKSDKIFTEAVNGFEEFISVVGESTAATSSASPVKSHHYVDGKFDSLEECEDVKHSIKIEEQSAAVSDKSFDNHFPLLGERSSSEETSIVIESLKKESLYDCDFSSASDSFKKTCISGHTVKCEEIIMETDRHREVIDKTVGGNSFEEKGTNVYDNSNLSNMMLKLINPKKPADRKIHASKEISSISENFGETIVRSSHGLGDSSKIILGYECPICVKIFPSDWALVQHSLSHQTFMCVHCTEKFPNEVILRSHLLSHVKESLSREELGCLMCSSCRSLSCVCNSLKQDRGIVGQHRLQVAKRSKREFVTNRIVSPFEGYRLTLQQFFDMNSKTSAEVSKKVRKRISSPEHTNRAPKRLKQACSGQIINDILKSDSDVPYFGDDVLLHNRTCQLCGESFDHKSQLNEHMFLHRLKGRNRRGMKRSKDHVNDTNFASVDGRQILNDSEKHCTTDYKSTSKSLIDSESNCSHAEETAYLDKCLEARRPLPQKSPPRYQIKCFFCQKIMKREQELRAHMKYKCSQAPKRSIKKLLGVGKTLMCLAAEGHGKLYDIVDTLTMQVLEDCVLVPDASTAPPAPADTNAALGKLVPKCKFCGMKFERVREVRRHIQNICHRVSKSIKKRIEEGATLEEVDAVELGNEVLTKRIKEHIILYREGPEDSGGIQKTALTGTDIYPLQHLQSPQYVNTKESRLAAKKCALRNTKRTSARPFSLDVQSKLEGKRSSAEYLQSSEDIAEAEFDGFTEPLSNKKIASLHKESLREREKTKLKALRSKIMRSVRKKSLVRTKNSNRNEVSPVHPPNDELRVIHQGIEKKKSTIIIDNEPFSKGISFSDKELPFDAEKNNLENWVESGGTSVTDEHLVTGNTIEQKSSNIQEEMNTFVHNATSSRVRSFVSISSNPLNSNTGLANVATRTIETSESSRSDCDASSDLQLDHGESYPAVSGSLHQVVNKDHKCISVGMRSFERLPRVEDVKSFGRSKADEIVCAHSTTGSKGLDLSSGLSSSDSFAPEVVPDSFKNLTEIDPSKLCVTATEDRECELLDMSDGMYCGIVVEDLKAEDFGGVECEMELLETCVEDRDESDEELMIDCDEEA